MKDLEYKIHNTLVKSLYPLTLLAIYLAIVNEEFLYLWLIIPANYFHQFCLSAHHRYVSHRAFETKYEWMGKLLILLSVFQITHSPLKFAIFHRHHHKYADEPGKDHQGPTVGALYSIFRWEYHLGEDFVDKKIQVHRDLLRDKFSVWVDKHYYKILFVFLSVMLIISYKFFLYTYIPSLIVFRITSYYFSHYHCHKFGYRTYNHLTDNSTNSVLANIFTFGEGWHNNHHNNPNKAIFGEKWYEWDPTGFIIKHFLMKKS